MNQSPPTPAGAGTTPLHLTRLYARWFWLLLGLFCLRVLGQLLVATLGVGFLPPMEEWFSGLVPYPRLLFSQIVIIMLLGAVCMQFQRGQGWFVRPRRWLATLLLSTGTLYLSVMMIRYIVRMSLYAPERWTGGSIPIFFHWVLASFVLILGYYHFRFSPRGARRSGRARVAYSCAGFTVILGILVWIAYLVAPAGFAHVLEASPPQFAVRVQSNVEMIASDGVPLVADVYRPRRADPTPTILVRIPYSKSVANTLKARLIGRLWAEHGYTAVIQGTRGRYKSGGTYYPLMSERRDGLDTLAWLAGQPWYDGRLGMWGGSYFGYTQWVLADQIDPGPSALFIQLASTSFYDMFYHGGALSLQSALYWALRSRGAEDVSVDEELFDSMPVEFPLVQADDRAGADVPFFNDWVLHPTRDDYWLSIDGVDRVAGLRAPALLLAGWFDPFLPSQIADFEQIRVAVAPEVSDNTHLIIGPWGHAFEPPLPGGQLPGNYRLASLAPSLPWFDRHLKGDTSQPQLPRVRLFIMGENVWRDEHEWPLARTKYTPYFLDGSENPGGLYAAPPVNPGQTTFSFDPRSPVPTHGGAMLGTRSGIQRQPDATRDDVLSFRTPPLEHDVEITGPVRMVLYVQTSAPSTDFTGLLLDVRPDGQAHNISEGILRRSYAGEADIPTRIEIVMWPTSIIVPRGHTLRVDISSSNYPRFDVNPNTGGEIATETISIVAEQTVYWGASTPSHIVLPLVPR